MGVRVPFGNALFPAAVALGEAPLDQAWNSSGVSDWLAWQLMDSAFPTGGFAHSAGLEAAWQLGEVRGREDLAAFAEASLDQLGHGGLLLVLAAFDEPVKLSELDDLCEAFTLNHIANRASRAQGRAFRVAVERIFGGENRLQKAGEPAPHGHFAPLFGASLQRLGIPRRTVGRMYFFNQLRTLLAAAVRLNIVGPMESQVLSHRLAPKAETLLLACEELTLDDIAQTAPLLDLWQSAQDRLYSRLFQS